MAFIATSKSVPFGAITTFQLVSKLNSVLRSVRENYEQRQTVVALNQLTNGQLNDIGLNRAELPQQVGIWH